jgi:hypothetical protein
LKGLLTNRTIQFSKSSPASYRRKFLLTTTFGPHFGTKNLTADFSSFSARQFQALG